MHTRILFIASALFLLVVGLLLSFVSMELLEWTTGNVDQSAVVACQLMGAAYRGFAFMNWMSRGATVGGIYGRPLTMANFLHFTMAGITLLKLALAAPTLPLVALGGIFAVFAAWFALVVFTPPASVRD